MHAHHEVAERQGRDALTLNVVIHPAIAGADVSPGIVSTFISDRYFTFGSTFTKKGASLHPSIIYMAYIFLGLNY